LHEARRKLNTTSGDINQAQVTSGEAGGGVIPSSNAMIPLETMQKLGTVMPLLSKTESLLPVVPALLARLHSLAALHTSTNSFVENIDQLEAGIKRSQTSHDEMRVILSNLEASFSENQKRVESNMQLVEERMENITTRIKNLHNG
jgi:nuclear migration protein JNM1